MFGVILKATSSCFQKGMTFCRSIYVKKVMKLLAFIFEQPSHELIYICQLFDKINPQNKINIFAWELYTTVKIKVKSHGKRLVSIYTTLTFTLLFAQKKRKW